MSAGFIDANGVSVYPPAEVQYEDGARHGELVEVFSDGDAYVCFFDNPAATELVKYCRLCAVPEEYRLACTIGGAPASLGMGGR